MSRSIHLFAIITIIAVLTSSCGESEVQGLSPETIERADPVLSGSSAPTSTVFSKEGDAAHNLDDMSFDGEEARLIYLNRVNQVTEVISYSARVVGGLALALSSSEGADSKTIGLAKSAKDSFDLSLEMLREITPPQDLNDPHSQLIESLEFYSKAAQLITDTSLLTSQEYSEFQENMASAGKRFHEASSTQFD